MAEESFQEFMSNLGAIHMAAKEASLKGKGLFPAMMQGFVGAAGVQAKAADPYFALRSTLMRQQAEETDLNLANLVTQRQILLQQQQGMQEFNAEMAKAIATGTMGEDSTTSKLMMIASQRALPLNALAPQLKMLADAKQSKQLQKFAQALSTPRPEVTGVIPGSPVPLPVVEKTLPTIPEALAKTPGLDESFVQKVIGTWMTGETREDIAGIQAGVRREGIEAQNLRSAANITSREKIAAQRDQTMRDIAEKRLQEKLSDTEKVSNLPPEERSRFIAEIKARLQDVTESFAPGKRTAEYDRVVEMMETKMKEARDKWMKRVAVTPEGKTAMKPLPAPNKPGRILVYKGGNEYSISEGQLDDAVKEGYTLRP